MTNRQDQAASGDGGRLAEQHGGARATCAAWADPADCPFCRRIAEHNYTKSTPLVVAFEPLNPVTPGHLLVVPRLHVFDALSDPDVTAYTMRAASVWADWASLNIITSVGRPATQSVYHLHVHLVPRRDGDGLHLPWTGQQRAEPADA